MLVVIHFFRVLVSHEILTNFKGQNECILQIEILFQEVLELLLHLQRELLFDDLLELVINVSVVVLVFEELRDSLPADWTLLRVVEVLPDALNAESMSARKQTRLNHDVHAN